MIRTAQTARLLDDDPDWQLVVAARQQDEAAIRELVRRMNPRLFRIARGIVPTDADAEDVVQEAYLNAFTHLDSFRGEARFSTWISRIVINAARMRIRRPLLDTGYDSVNEDSAPSADVLAFPGADSAEATTGRHQIRPLLEEAVGRLPPELRLPFVLYEVEGLSIRAIATDLNLNPITVRTRLFRARRRLRQSLEIRLKGGFDAIFPFDGARCAHMADRVIAGLKARRG